MSEGPQYTSCVDKADWTKGGVALAGAANIVGVVAGILAAIAGFGALAAALLLAATVEILRNVAEWMLNGKLVCLRNVKRRVFVDPDPDRICVLGTVLDFEKVGEDKTGPENIDNDFGLNLFIGPFAQADLATVDSDVLRRRMDRSSQGDLIQDPAAPAPAPGDPDPGPGPLMRKDDPSQLFGSLPVGFNGYQRGLMFSALFPRPVPKNVFSDPHELAAFDPAFAQLADEAHAKVWLELQSPVDINGVLITDSQRAQMLADLDADPLADPRVSQEFYKAVVAAYGFVEVKAQALHCEFEGSRIRDVYNVLDWGHVHCKKGGFLGFVCGLLNLIISVALAIPKLIAVAAAWALAKDGDINDAFDDSSGPILTGDSIVVRGRWVYDSAHSGYNEIHAVRTVQKTQPAPTDPAAFVAFHDAWCGELAKVPPAPPTPRGRAGRDDPPDDGKMTPFQKPTHDAQGRPENQWVVHPLIDGCVPATAPDSPRPPAFQRHRTRA